MSISKVVFRGFSAPLPEDDRPPERFQSRSEAGSPFSDSPALLRTESPPLFTDAQFMEWIFVDYDFEYLFIIEEAQRLKLLEHARGLSFVRPAEFLERLNLLEQLYNRMSNHESNRIIEELRPIVAKGKLTEPLEAYLRLALSWTMSDIHLLKSALPDEFECCLAGLALTNQSEEVWKAIPNQEAILGLLTRRQEICEKVRGFITELQSLSQL